MHSETNDALHLDCEMMNPVAFNRSSAIVRHSAYVSVECRQVDNTSVRHAMELWWEGRGHASNQVFPRG